MIGFTPVQIVLNGDRQAAEGLIGTGRNLLFKLQMFMSHQNLQVGGPWFVRGDGFVVMAKCINGVRAYIDIFVKQHVVPVKEIVVGGFIEKMLLFWGPGYERITFEYNEDSALFLPGEGVSCSGGGGGEVVLVNGSSVLGEFIRCWDRGDSIAGNTSGASGIISSCRKYVYADTYESREITSEFTTSIAERVESPVDVIFRSCHDHFGSNVFSKTVDELTVAGYEYGESSYSLNWGLCAKFKGISLTFDGKLAYEASDFARTRLRFQGLHMRLVTFEVLIDCWREGDQYFIGACGQGFMRVWSVDPETHTCIPVFSYRLKATSPPDGADGKWESEVCGYYKYYAFVNANGGIIIETVRPTGTDSSSSGEGGDSIWDIQTIWNPVNEKLYVWTEEPGGVLAPFTNIAMLGQTFQFYAIGWYCECILGGYDGCSPTFPCEWSVGSWGAKTLTINNASITYGVFYGYDPGVSIDKWVHTYTDLDVQTVHRTTFGRRIIQEVGIDSATDYASFDRGYNDLRFREGRQYQDYSDSYWPDWPLDDLCISTHTEFTLNDWNITPDGLAYRVSPKKVDWCDPGQNSTNDGGASMTRYLDFDEWEAVLKSGIDSEGRSITAPCVCYHDPKTDEIYLVSSANPDFGFPIPLQLLGPGDRAFFQYSIIPKDKTEV